MATDAPARETYEQLSVGRGGRLERLVPIALVLGVVLTVIDVVWTFTLAPLVQGAQLSEPVVIAGTQVTTKLLLSQKIFYLHVPVAVASFAIMLFAAIWAVRFLMTKSRRFDLYSKTSMEVTLVFIVATMISGDLWTRFEWGVWWTWEPRLTTYFILMLLVIGYFILRNALDDPERRARFSAVFCIVAFVDAPISFMITRLVPSSIHPVVFRTDSGLPPMMLIPFLLGLFGMLLIAFALTRLALRINVDAQEVEDLKERLEEQDAWKTRAAADAALERLRADASNLTAAAPTSDGSASSVRAAAASDVAGAGGPASDGSVDSLAASTRDASAHPSDLQTPSGAAAAASSHSHDSQEA
ncbi:cytochrome c biogenesis protein CcsA [Collinsella sp. An2]|uniref:cytochrome c biogenesis protein n=1 Tax=Collinsella sp. An2 TaxID=1965585 RepID=UPI000B3980D1|nr:cytochrome c biogenesis protein CcsA [Collinsella sp. An2]OUP06816.1 cytochrome C assembly protein [Collinsella sp. An2]